MQDVGYGWNAIGCFTLPGTCKGVGELPILILVGRSWGRETCVFSLFLSLLAHPIYYLRTPFFFSLPSRRNSKFRVYLSRPFFPVPTAIRVFYFNARRLETILPSSTRI